MQHTSNPKVQAKHLQRLLAEAGTPTTHAQAQQLVARSLGFKSWQALKAAVPEEPKPTLAYALDLVMDYDDDQTYQDTLLLRSAEERDQMQAYLLALASLFSLRGYYRVTPARPARVVLEDGSHFTTRAQALDIFLESSEYHRMTSGGEYPEVDVTVLDADGTSDTWNVAGDLDELQPDTVRDMILVDQGQSGPHTARIVLDLLVDQEETGVLPEGFTVTLKTKQLTRWLAVKAAEDDAWMPAHEAVMRALMGADDRED